MKAPHLLLPPPQTPNFIDVQQLIAGGKHIAAARLLEPFVKYHQKTEKTNRRSADGAISMAWQLLDAIGAKNSILKEAIETGNVKNYALNPDNWSQEDKTRYGALFNTAIKQLRNFELADFFPKLKEIKNMIAEDESNNRLKPDENGIVEEGDPVADRYHELKTTECNLRIKRFVDETNATLTAIQQDPRYQNATILQQALQICLNNDCSSNTTREMGELMERLKTEFLDSDQIKSIETGIQALRDTNMMSKPGVPDLIQTLNNLKKQPN